MSNFLKDRVVAPNYMRGPAPDPEESDLSFKEGFDAAAPFVQPTPAVSNLIDESRIKADPAYRLDFEKEMEDVPEYARPSLAEALEDSRSLEHTKYIKQKVLGELESARTLDEYTGGSVMGALGMSLAAGIVDPLNLGVGVGTAGVGLVATAARGAYRMSRLKRAMVIAGLEGAANAALEVPLYLSNKTADGTDILWAAAFGASIGGVAGAISPPKLGTIAQTHQDASTVAADQLMDNMAKVEVAEMKGVEPASVPLSDDVEQALRQDPLHRQERPETAEAAREARVEAPDGIDWKVRQREEFEAEEIRAKAIEIQETKLKEVSAREVGDEPVAPLVRRDDLDDFNQEVAFYKTLDDQNLSAKDKTRAKVEFNKAKGEFLEKYRDADPQGYQRIFGNRDRLNPPAAEVEKALPEIQKRMDKLEEQYTKDAEAFRTKVDEIATEKDLLIDSIEELKKAEPQTGFGKKTAGAAQIANPERFADGTLELGRYDPDHVDKIYDDVVETRQQRIGWFGSDSEAEGLATRFDLHGKLARSPNAEIRYANQQLLDDGQTKAGHQVNPPGAEVIAETLRDAIVGPYQAAARLVLPKFAEEIGKKHNLLTRLLDWDGKLAGMLDIEVTRAIREGHHELESVREAADALRKGFERSLEVAKEYNLPGWEEIMKDPNYLPRLISDQRLADVNGAAYDISPDQFSAGIESAPAEFIYRAIMEANDTFDPEMTARVANAWAHNIVARAAGDPPMPDIQGQASIERVRDWLDSLDLSDVDRKNFEAAWNPKTEEPDAGRTARSRFRVNLKEDHEPLMAKYTGPDTGDLKYGDTVQLSYRDLLEDRAGYLLTAHANETAGWSALWKNLGIKNEADLNQYRRRIVQHESNQVKDGKRLVGLVEGRSPFNLELRGIDIGFNKTLGRAITDPSAMRTIRRVAGGYNFTRVMNQVVFAQLSEASKIITATSIKTVKHYSPVLKDTLKSMRNGERPSAQGQAWINAAQEYVGLASNTARGGTVRKYAVDTEGALLSTENKWLQRLDHAKKITSRPLTLAMDFEEVLGFASFSNEFSQRLKGVKQFSEGDYKRFAAIGLSKSKMNRIRQQMKKYALDEQGNNYFESDSEWMGNLQLDKWDDVEARNMFAVGMRRKVNNMVQTNQAGNLPQWALSEGGQLIAQFRTFMLAAHQKQLLHHISYNDRRAYLEFAANAVSAATFYTAQKYLHSLGREDAEAYRSRMLSPETILRASWERSAWSGLTPFVGDAIGAATGLNLGNPYSTRSTGLGRGTSGIPVADMFNKFNQLGGDLLAIGTEEGKSASKLFKNAWALAPFQNYLGLSNAAQLFAQALPDDE